MTYVTIKQPVQYHQMSIEEFLGLEKEKPSILNPNETNTRTERYDVLPYKLQRGMNIDRKIRILKDFNAKYADLRAKPREDQYLEHRIPKRTGGFRTINPPKAEMMQALKELKLIFENDMKVKYHTSAFAYVKGRCTVDAVKRHQANESKWFSKLDLHGFFPSTTLEFVMKQFEMIFPFSEIVRRADGREALHDALELCFLKGGLPQGSPVSPLITNVMMIPVDFELANMFRDFNKQRFIYTRYADDFIISSRYDFKVADVERAIIDTLKKFEAPFSLNREKTHYGSNAGHNFMLGTCLNRENRITVGAKNKKRFQAMLYSYLADRKNGVYWKLEDVQHMEGTRAYYRMVEGETIDALVNRIGEKFGVDAMACIKKDLATLVA